MGSLTEETLSPLNDDPAPDHINYLNNDCLAHIFICLRYSDRVKVGRVCRRWREISVNCWNEYARLNTSLEIGTDTGTFPHREETLNLELFEQMLKHRGPYLTKISFSESCKDKFKLEGLIKMVIQYCPRIRKIHAENVLLWQADLTAIAACSQIVSLGLGNTWIPVEGRSIFGRPRYTTGFSDMMRISCGYGINVMDIGLQPIFKSNKNLRHLTLSRNNNPIGMSLMCLEPHCLESLHVIECPYFRFDDTCLQRFEYSLRELIVYYKYDTDTLNLSYVPRLKNLRKIKLVGQVWIMEEQVVSVLHQIARSCLKLEHVDLGKMCFMASDNDIGPMLSLPELREIVIIGKTNITSQVFLNKTLHKLERLTLPCCWLTEKDYVKLVDRLPQLKFLNICDCGVRRESEWLWETKEKGIKVVIRTCESDELRY